MRSALPLLATLSATLVAGLLTGCSDEDGGDQLTVVTSIYPLEYVAERVAGEHATVTTLTSPGQEPHDLELGIRQTAELTDADLVVYGKGFQPAVDEAVEASAGGVVVEALATIDQRPPAIPGPRPARTIPGDPHFWLDPRAMATVAAEVAERLAELDPDHAADYEENAAVLFTELVDLDGDFAVGLDDCALRTVVVSHDAFGYLGHRYDLDFEAIAGLSPEAEPSPRHIAELHDLAETKGITTVFSETLASADLAETLASDLGLATGVLDPVEGLSDETEDEDYLSLMRTNLEALREANGCR